MKTLVLLSFFLFVGCIGTSNERPNPANSEDDGKHLFILSGQSNMSGLKPEVSFTPKVAAEFGTGNVIVLKYAAFGQPIRMWYKNWKPEEGRPMIPPGGRKDKYAIGTVYERIIKAVKKKIEGQNIKTVNLLWMQGEGDIRGGHSKVYADSFKGLMKQLEEDLNYKNINFVIGRISDYGLNRRGADESQAEHWKVIRKAQVDLAENSPYGDWIDCDTFNNAGKKERIHYSKEGYETLGRLFAEKIIKLIKNSPPKKE